MKIIGHKISEPVKFIPWIVDVHWMGREYGWCYAVYNVAGDMSDDHEPQYFTYKRDAIAAAERFAEVYNVLIVVGTKTGEVL